jgi:Zn-dependent alcohol dehydrogenase
MRRCARFEGSIWRTTTTGWLGRPHQIQAIAASEMLWLHSGQTISAVSFEKRIQGCFMGSNRFRIDMPRLIEFYQQGWLNLDDMISGRGKLENVNEAFRAMKAGEVARTVLMFD